MCNQEEMKITKPRLRKVATSYVHVGES